MSASPHADAGEETPAPPAPEITEPAPRRIAIVGFTASREEAPWGVEGWEIWACNNLHRFCPPTWHRLYDLHDLKTIRGDEEHVKFLSGQTVKHASGNDYALGDRPVFTFYPQPEWPKAVQFPREAILDRYGRYFTNSISWMIAHALLEMEAAATQFAAAKLTEMAPATEDPKFFEMVAPGLRVALEREYMARCELAIFGVDLATGGEYAAQRPSAENMLGIAQGMGVKIHIPESSDLLKCAGLYGSEEDSALYAKCAEREAELLERGKQLEAVVQQREEAEQAHQARLLQEKLTLARQQGQLQGALETTRYFREVWTSPRANRDGSAKSAATSAQPEEAKAA